MDLMMTKALDHVDYKVALIQKKYNRNDNAQNVKFVKAVAGVLAGLTPAEQEVYTGYLSGKLSISVDTLTQETRSLLNKQQTEQKYAPEKEKEPEKPVISKADINLEKMIIKLSYINSEHFALFDTYEGAFITDTGIAISDVYRTIYRPGEDFDADKLRDYLSEDAYSYFNLIIETTPVGDEEVALKDCISKLEKKKRQSRIKEIEKTLQMLDDMQDDSRAKEDSIKLMQELSQLRKMK